MVDIAEPNLNRLEASLNPGKELCTGNEVSTNNLKGMNIPG